MAETNFDAVAGALNADFTVKTHKFSDAAILYKFGNVVMFAVRNVTPGTLTGYTIPQGYRPAGVPNNDNINFLLESYDGYGANARLCYLWIIRATGVMSIDNASALVSGAPTWITEE